MHLEDPQTWWSRADGDRTVRRILLCGTWDFTGPDPLGQEPPAGVLNSSTADALAEVAAGFMTACPQCAIDVVPFGGGATFQQAVESRTAGPYSDPDAVVWAFAQGRRESSSAGIARELLNALEAVEIGRRDAPELILLEGSHSWSLDLGLGFVRAISGNYELTWTSSASAVADALATVGEKLDGLPLVYAASTGRQMLGAGSIVDLDPNLQPHSENRWRTLASQLNLADGTDPRQAAAKWGKALAEYADSRPEDRFPKEFAQIPSPTPDPQFRRGGGAGGGTAALLSSVGVAICDTGELLYRVLGLTALLRDKDLVVAVEPYLDAGCLMESTLPVISSAAMRWGIPVVAATARATIGVHELASWHLNGVSQLKRGRDLTDLGRRLGQTWGML